MSVLPRYLLRNTAMTSLTISLILTLILWLTQSLRLLDFIVNGGAPLKMFGGMLILTIPKFFEVILPIGLALGIVYTLNKFSADSEMVVMQNTGLSPLRLSSGIIFLAVMTALVVFALSGWMTPIANRKLDSIRDLVRSNYSVGLLRPGIFNTMGDNTTIYVSKRTNLQNLGGVFIHFNAKDGQPATTITAKQGGMSMQNGKPYVVVFDGARQQINRKTGNLELLRFKRYALDLSSLSSGVVEGSRSPDEHTLTDLLRTGAKAPGIKNNAMRAEMHMRLARPLLTLAFAMLSLVPFVLGHYNRRGQALRLTIIIAMLIVLQGVFFAGASIIQQFAAGLILLYGLPVILCAICLYFLAQGSFEMKGLSPVSWLLGGKERLV